MKAYQYRHNQFQRNGFVRQFYGNYTSTSYSGPRFSGHRNEGGYHRPNYQSSSAKPPVNHSWEQEWSAPKNIPTLYKTVGLVVWVEGSIGELLCERNLRSPLLHFYFDGRTEIDGTVVALAEKSEEGLGIIAGSKVEFETNYDPQSHSDAKTPFHVHVLKISVLTKETETEELMVSVVSFPDNLHTSKIAMNKDGDFVLISPVLFTRKWIIECAETQRIGAAPDFEADEMRNLLFPGRTLSGRVIKSPRWVQDVLGGQMNPKQLLLTIDNESPVFRGYGTVRSIVPLQSIVIEADDLPGQLMFYPIVALPRNIKDQYKVGCRVEFNACAELPGFAYNYRVIEACVQDPRRIPPVSRSETPILVSIGSAPPSPVLEQQKELTYASELEQIFADLSTKHEDSPSTIDVEIEEFLGKVEPVSPSACGPVHDTDLTSFESRMDKQEEEEESEQEGVEETSHHIAISEFSSPTSAVPIQPELLTLPLTASPETVRLVLGCSVEDDCVGEERCQYPHTEGISWTDDYNHVVMTAAELLDRKAKRKEEKDKLKAERKAARYEERLRHRERKEAREKQREVRNEHVVTKKSSSHSIVAAPLPLRITEAPDTSVNVIGFYDDVFSIFNQLLVANEDKKRAELAKKDEEKQDSVAVEDSQEVKPTKGGWWFRRRSPRILPTVLVEELLIDRTEEEICVDYDVNSLTQTIVLRNKIPGRNSQPSDTKYIGPSQETKLQENNQGVISATHVLEKKQSEVSEKAQPVNKSAFTESLLKDEIFNTFFHSLLKK